jgi:hypothetical protein
LGRQAGRRVSILGSQRFPTESDDLLTRCSPLRIG